MSASQLVPSFQLQFAKEKDFHRYIQQKFQIPRDALKTSSLVFPIGFSDDDAFLQFLQCIGVLSRSHPHAFAMIYTTFQGGSGFSTIPNVVGRLEIFENRGSGARRTKSLGDVSVLKEWQPPQPPASSTLLRPHDPSEILVGVVLVSKDDEKYECSCFIGPCNDFARSRSPCRGGSISLKKVDDYKRHYMRHDPFHSPYKCPEPECGGRDLMDRYDNLRAHYEAQHWPKTVPDKKRFIESGGARFLRSA